MDNYAQNRKWKTSTGLAFWGSSIQAVFNFIGLSLGLYLAYNLTDILLGGILPSVASMSLDYYKDRFIGFIGGAMICFVIGFLGYLLYMVGVCLFTGAQTSENSKIKTRNIMFAELIGPVLVILFYVGYYTSPETLGLILEHYAATGITLCALYLAAVIIPMVEFKALTKENTWSEKAQQGADDLKFSYSCILWGWGVVIFGFGIAAIAVYSTITKLRSLSSGYDMYGNAIQGITSVAQEAQNLVAAIKIIMLFACIFIFIFALLQTCYRISGWNKIKRGVNEVITPAYEVNEDEDGDNRKKWMLWGGIAAGIIVVAAILWGVWGRQDKKEEYTDVKEMVEEAVSEISESDSYTYEDPATEDAMDEEPEPVMEKVWLGQLEMTGKVDGKYPVRMEITMDYEGGVSGTIWYLKYNVPMELKGTFTNTEDSRDLSLEEISEGKVTGNFIGRYDGRVFSGSWVSADGAKEMPFEVAR